MHESNEELFAGGIWSLGFFRPDMTNKSDPSNIRGQFINWIETETDFMDRLNWNGKNLYYPELRQPRSMWSALEYVEQRREGRLDHGWGNPNGFHQDMSGQITFQIIWSNTRPTEIKPLSSKEVIVPRPFEVVGFNNAIHEHRMPTDMHISTARRRYFIRSWTDRMYFK